MKNGKNSYARLDSFSGYGYMPEWATASAKLHSNPRDGLPVYSECKNRLSEGTKKNSMKVRIAKRQYLDIVLVACAFSYPLTSIFSGSATNLKFLSAIFLVVLSAYSFLKVGWSVRISIVLTICLTIIFFLLAILYLWPISSQEKIIVFLGVIAIFGIAAAFILLRDRYVSIIDQSFVLIGLIAIIAFLSSPTSYQEARVSFDNNNPIWMARVLGLAAIGAVHLLVSRQYSPLFLLPIIFVSLATIVATGSRGPLLAVIAAIVAAAFFSPYKKKVISLIALGFFFIAVFIFIELSGFSSNARGLSFSLEETQTEAIRLETYAYALFLISQNTFGIGIGQFYYLWQTYPHNIFLEFLVEWGWLSGGLMVYLIVFAGYKLFIDRKTHLFLFLIYVYELVNSLLSGDVTSPRFLYAVVFFAIIKSLEDTFRASKVSIK